MVFREKNHSALGLLELLELLGLIGPTLVRGYRSVSLEERFA